MKNGIHECWFCDSDKTYVDSHATRLRGTKQDYISQVRCRSCCARGPKVNFTVTVEPGYPDLDRTDPESAVSKADRQAIKRWNKTTITNTEKR